MYTMVLMAAMSGGADMPDCHRRRSHGCDGGCHGTVQRHGGCHGTAHRAGCQGAVYHGGCQGGAYYPSGGNPYKTMPPAKQPEKVPPPKGGGEEQFQSPNENRDLPPPETSARLTVDVPADARVFIDDQPTATTSAQRTFSTPSLEKGYRYHYTVRAEVVRNGTVFTGIQQISFGAGDQVRVNFNEREMTSTAVAQPVGQ